MTARIVILLIIPKIDYQTTTKNLRSERAGKTHHARQRTANSSKSLLPTREGVGALPPEGGGVIRIPPLEALERLLPVGEVGDTYPSEEFARVGEGAVGGRS